MAQQATPVRRARLGKALGPEPTAVGGVGLRLPPAAEGARRRPSPMMATATVRTLGRRLGRAARDEGLVTHVAHYRYRGWNGEEAHRAQGAAWAAAGAGRRHAEGPGVLARRGRRGRPRALPA